MKIANRGKAGKYLMGIYVDPGNAAFEMARFSDLYVDKSMLISKVNEAYKTEKRFLCVSRPRRFGKSMAANMLSAYYSCGCDSAGLFSGLKIEETMSYKKHLNKHHVIRLDIQKFIFRESHLDIFIDKIQELVIKELGKVFGSCFEVDLYGLPGVLEQIFEHTGKGFIFIIDEWDCVFRIAKERKGIQKDYLDFLRGLFKGQDYVELAYMTGILPVKKYGTQSALNNFDEYTMISPAHLDRFFGFTEEEATRLCEEHQLDFQEVRRWYDGYVFDGGLHIYSPKSVLEAVQRKHFDCYWAQTETYESLKYYMEMNYGGLRDDILKMLDGDAVAVDPCAFQNDMVSFRSKDDVLTLLVHLGYLAYHEGNVWIPNEEVRDEFFRTVRNTDWDEIIKMTERSDRLLEAAWEMDGDQVAKMLDEAHQHPSVSHLKYNDENSLSYVITNAFFCASKDYIWVRELPAGKGFADIVYLPKRGHDKPAMVVELKWDKSADGAIAQIQEKQYAKVLENFTGDILLIGINYNRKTRKHECRIVRYKS